MTWGKQDGTDRPLFDPDGGRVVCLESETN